MHHLDPTLTGSRFLAADEFLAERHIVEPMPQAHWHDHVELNVICQGGMSYLINGGQIHLRQGAIYCFWAAVPHQVISAVAETELVCVYMPFADLLSLAISNDFKNDLMVGHVLTSLTLDAADVSMFQRWALDWEDADEQVRDLLRDEVRIRIRRIAIKPNRADLDDNWADTAHMRGNHLVAGRHSIDRVQRMTNFINEEFARPISVDEIAQVCGLHQTNATALFQKVLGITIAQYLRRRRLNEALKLLAGSNRTIVEVAYESGYGSLSRFYDSFQKQLGCTPREYRLRLRS